MNVLSKIVKKLKITFLQVIVLSLGPFWMRNLAISPTKVEIIDATVELPVKEVINP